MEIKQGQRAHALQITTILDTFCLCFIHSVFDQEISCLLTAHDYGVYPDDDDASKPCQGKKLGSNSIAIGYSIS